MYIKILLTIIALGFSTTICLSQESKLDRLIKLNKYIIEQDGNEFSGPGIDYILQQAKDVQFLGLAENHNTMQVPIFTSYLFKQLHNQHDFNYLALEQDPIMMKLLSSRKYNAVEMAKKYNHGFTFIADQEVDMIHEVVNISKSPNSIWGCDQSSGVSHVLDEIMESCKPNSDSYEELKSLVEKMKGLEATRESNRYIGRTSSTRDIKRIQEILQNNHISPDLLEYFNHVVISNSIYSDFRNAKYHESRSFREYYMRGRFIEEFKRAQQIDSLPKVVLKFGHYHLMDGFNIGSQVNGVGNLIRSLAQFNNKKSLVINMQIYRNDGSDWDYLDESYPEFVEHSDINSWTLFDLRPIRAGFNNGDYTELIEKEYKEYFEELVNRYDLLLIIGNGGDGTWDYMDVK